MSWPDQAWRFVLVGGLVGLAWALSTLVLSALGLRASVASLMAFLCCIPLAYIGHRKFTFRSRKDVRIELPRFLANSILGMTVAWGIPSIAGNDLTLSILAVPVLVMVVSFVVARVWVFVQS